MKLPVNISTCNLNQWALDFKGNYERIIESIRRAKAMKARLRIGPELEITGYGCEDHFLESDTIDHAWETLKMILTHELCTDILLDIGIPLHHNGVLYNCRVICLNRRILLIRPKRYLANDGNYRETRWFTGWNDERGLEEYCLPPCIRDIDQQRTCPIGIAILHTRDNITLACETCEELFTPNSPHITLSLDGTDILTNGSGSHHQLRKLNTRVDLMREATNKCGGVYMYANQQGCDGGRLYFDGCAMIMINGKCVGQGTQFSVNDVEVITATVDIDDVRSYRACTASRNVQAASIRPAPRIYINDFDLQIPRTDYYTSIPSRPRAIHYLLPEQEIGFGPACWLWDYLRRSGSSGFFLPLSGGADSASTCAIVGIMCELVMHEISQKNTLVLEDLRKVTKEPDFTPTSAQDIANRIMHTCYMGTANSGKPTQKRAEKLANEIGVYHSYANIDRIVAAVLAVFLTVTETLLGAPKQPQFSIDGGSMTEDLALQNIQARTRMVLAYLLAQLLPWVRGRKGWLLVLGSANVDEALRGYMTKYDCSSADINPIGGISKQDIRSFLAYASKAYPWPTLGTILEAPPTAELRPMANTPRTFFSPDVFTAPHRGGQSNQPTSPVRNSLKLGSPALTGVDANNGTHADVVVDGSDGEEGEHSQLDEDEMGMTYDELSWFGRLRKDQRCGPLAMYQKLLFVGSIWTYRTPREIAEKVKRFFFYYSMNRHKMTTLTPSYHAESYSPEDNRYDLRPFLYNTKWDVQFAAIDEDVKQREALMSGSNVSTSLVYSTLAQQHLVQQQQQTAISNSSNHHPLPSHPNPHNLQLPPSSNKESNKSSSNNGLQKPPLAATTATENSVIPTSMPSRI